MVRDIHPRTYGFASAEPYRQISVWYARSHPVMELVHPIDDMGVAVLGVPISGLVDCADKKSTYDNHLSVDASLLSSKWAMIGHQPRLCLSHHRQHKTNSHKSGSSAAPHSSLFERTTLPLVTMGSMMCDGSDKLRKSYSRRVNHRRITC